MKILKKGDKMERGYGMTGIYTSYSYHLFKNGYDIFKNYEL